jgi:hypothetical protein
MGEERDKYMKLGFYLGLISLIISLPVSVYTLYMASENLRLVQETLQVGTQQLQLQNISNNYTALLTGYGDSAQLGSPSSWSRTGNITITEHYGYMQVPLTVICPHYTALAITITDFTVEASAFLDSERLEDNSVDFVLGQPYTSFLDIGLNEVTPNLHLVATVYVKSDAMPPAGTSQTLYLGMLEMKAVMDDIQTGKTNFVQLLGRVYVSLENSE